MKRREFLTTAGLSVLAVSTFGNALLKGDQFTGDCTTTSDILGPFYRPDAPVRAELFEGSVKGEQLTIKGHVFSQDCTSIIENAVVEIWHADVSGGYDNETDNYQFRGQQSSNKNGAYGFSTILPGRYLNGKTFRPAHYHFRVTAPGHKELISQVYVKGDPFIESDPWASAPKAQLRILEIRDKGKGLDEIRFDIFLDKV